MTAARDGRTAGGRLGLALGVAALVAAVVPSLVLALAPAYAGVATVHPGPHTAHAAHGGAAALARADGPWAYAALAVPVLATALPLLARRWRRADGVHAGCAAALLAFVILTGRSVGLLYLPAAALTLVGVPVASNARRAGR